LLIVLMLAVIWIIQRLVGERTLGRRTAGPDAGMAQLGCDSRMSEVRARGA
jgi:hypothetical protein